MTAHWTHLTDREGRGTCRFRLMPSDEFTASDSVWSLAPAAGGVALRLEYTWEHRTDGRQSGILLLGSPDDQGVLMGAWMDSWHQQPFPMVPTGRITEDGRAHLAAEYGGGWGWELELRVNPGAAAGGAQQAGAGGAVQLVMRNVVPASAITPEHPGEPGPYEVMVLDLA